MVGGLHHVHWKAGETGVAVRDVQYVHFLEQTQRDQHLNLQMNVLQVEVLREERLLPVARMYSSWCDPQTDSLSLAD